MGRAPCCDENGLKKGPWTAEEDKKLMDFIQRHGHGSWRALPKLAGLNRCGKSCRLRWTNYLRPDIKRGKFTQDEEETIISLHSILGNKWSAIAGHLSGRTDNEIKNYWNTHLKKKLLQMGIDPVTHRPRADLSLLANLPHILAAATNLAGPSPMVINPLENAAQLAKLQIIQNILQVLSTNNNPNPNPFQPQDLIGFLGTSISSSNQTNHLLDGLINPSLQFPCNLLPAFGSSHQEQTNTSMATDPSLRTGVMDPNSHMPALVTVDDCLDGVNNSSAINEIGREMFIDTKIIEKDMSNPCSTTTTNTTFEVWNEMLDDEASNSYWRDFIYQASPSWPTS